MMLPRVLQPTQQERKTSSSVSEANAQFRWQFVEGPTQNHCDDPKLSLGGHAHRPRHHVFGHTLGREHVPGMNQHRRVLLCTVMEKSNNPGIIEISVADMIADLHA